MGGRWTVGGTGNGMELAGWEEWSLRWRFFHAFLFLGKLYVLFGPSMTSQSSPKALHQAALSNPISSWEFSHISMDHHLPSWSPHLLAAPNHPGDEIPELVLNQLFLEITPHFLHKLFPFASLEAH